MIKNILILGTGRAQADIIKSLKKDGFFVHACSYTSNDFGEQFVDKFALINISDVNAVKKYAEENNIDAVYSVGSDIAMPTAFKVSEQLGLPCFASSDTARICNTKTELRKALGNDFIGNINYQEISDINEPLSVSFPAVMKPVDSQGQRGVFKITDRADFEKHFENSMSFSRAKRLIVEEYIDGDEISVNAFSLNSQLMVCVVSDREIWSNYPGGIIHRHILPSKYSSFPEVEDSILNLVKDALARLNIKNGPSYFQIKIKDGKYPKLIEVTPRLDGCHMWRLIEYSTGINLLELTKKLLCENKPDDKEFLSSEIKPSVLEFLCEEPGKVFNRSKYDLSDAEYLEWYYQDGDCVRKMNGYIEKGGYKITEAK